MRAPDELMRLDELTDSSVEERELAELLTVLIDEYETPTVSHTEGQPASDAATFDGGARFNSKRSVEGIRIKRDCVRGVSRKARN